MKIFEKMAKEIHLLLKIVGAIILLGVIIVGAIIHDEMYTVYISTVYRIKARFARLKFSF